MTFTHERRAEPRVETKLRAVLFAVETNTRFEGTIANLSDSGARIEVDAGQDAMLAFLPPGARLRLVVRAEHVYECELRWKQSRSVGVQFIDLASRATRASLLSRLRTDMPSP